jgi:hypothetical protein
MIAWMIEIGLGWPTRSVGGAVSLSDMSLKGGGACA